VRSRYDGFSSARGTAAPEQVAGDGELDLVYLFGFPTNLALL
jgi:hypothetical protein